MRDDRRITSVNSLKVDLGGAHGTLGIHPEPDPKWVACFERTQIIPGYPRPAIKADQITFTNADAGQIKGYIRAVKELVTRTNDLYRSEVVPEQERKTAEDAGWKAREEKVRGQIVEALEED